MAFNIPSSSVQTPEFFLSDDNIYSIVYCWHDYSFINTKIKNHD